MLRKSFLFLILTASIGIASCKKKHSCLCSTTYTEAGYSPYTVSSTKEIDSKTTKKTAERICAQTEKQLGKNNSDYIVRNEKVSVTCALK